MSLIKGFPFSRVRDQASGEEVLEVALGGELLIDHPLLNKGSAFSDEERSEFELTGLLPPHVSSIDDQVRRNYENYSQNTNDLGRYTFLTSLQDRNEVLFYRLVEEYISEMLPIVYTPVVGAASQSYSHIYRRPRGLYVDFPHRDIMDVMLRRAPRREVEALVVTDGERILGLGDLGIGGMGIPIGKLSLYTLCAGIHPATTLPVLLDVGTDNQQLLDDPLYLGWRHQRVRGADYDAFIDAFVQAVKRTFPGALLQWEDFSRTNARRLLDRYRGEICSFNDDIQGTGSVTLAALLSAVMAAGSTISRQRVAILGAGSAATGVADHIVAAMMSEGMSQEAARSEMWLVDIVGLLHTGRTDLEPFNQMYAQDARRISEWKRTSSGEPTLFDVVNNVRPTVLIGLSGKGGAFTEQIVRQMAGSVRQPIIFPLSNPTVLSEAHPENLLAWTDGRAIVATGSPFAKCSAGGDQIRVAQCNNVYIFPGMALGVLAGGASRIADEMFLVAARTLASLSPALKDPRAGLLPEIEDIREVSRRVAFTVAQEAQKIGLAPPCSEPDLLRLIDAKMWRPAYARYKRVSSAEGS
ncbi:MAG TPA: NAD-dependent malic enzyme [Blastocatellia bacterium]